jgi:hypothetical protein
MSVTTTKIANKPEEVSDWFEERFTFFKSPEGEAEYKKLGLPYPKTLMDYWYKQFEKPTKNTKKEEHKIYVPQMNVLFLPMGKNT